MTSPIDHNHQHVFPEQDLSSLHILGTGIYKNPNEISHCSQAPLFHHQTVYAQHPEPPNNMSQQMCIMLENPSHVLSSSPSSSSLSNIHIYDLTSSFQNYNSGHGINQGSEEPFVYAKLPVALFQRVVEMLSAPRSIPQQVTVDMGAHSFNDNMIVDIQNSSGTLNSMVNTSSSSIEGNGTPTRELKRVEDDFHIKGSWTEEEDKLLIDLVRKHGAKRWSHIATQLKGRIGKQCRERYLNHLDPRISKKAWAPEEDDIIVEMHSKYGNQWAKISRELHGRTANAIKNHWNSTLSRRNEMKKAEEFQSMTQNQENIAPIPTYQTPGDTFDNEESHPFSGSSFNASGQEERKRSHEDHELEGQRSIKRVKVESELTLETDENISDFNPYSSNMYSNPSNPSISRRNKYGGLTLQLNEEEEPSHSTVLTFGDSHPDFDLNSICQTPKIGSFSDCALGNQFLGSRTTTSGRFLSPTNHFFLPNTPDAQTTRNNGSRSSDSTIDIWSSSEGSQTSSSVRCS